MLDKKYEVRKIEIKESGGKFLSAPFPNNEFWVIRKQDILAAPTLWSYVNALRTAIDTLKLAGYFESEEVKSLEEKANQAAQLASLWEQSSLDDKKLPD